MRLIGEKHAQKTLERALKNSGDFSLTFYTLKKDRSLAIQRCGQRLIIQEEGYTSKLWEEDVHSPTLKKQLRALWQREFPRSHKLYFKD